VKNKKKKVQALPDLDTRLIFFNDAAIRK